MDLGEQVHLDALELSVGDVEEVAGPAGRVEDLEAQQLFPEGAQVRHGVGVLQACLPGPDDGRAHDLLYVCLAGEVGAEGVAVGLLHAALEQGAEDLGLHLPPVLGRGLGQELHLAGVELDGLYVLEDAAVEVLDFLEAPAARAGFGLPIWRKRPPSRS